MAQAPTETVVILPFENVSDHPEYNWIGESFSDSLSALLNKPGLIVVSNDERAVAYQRLRLPLTVLPSRATAIKIGRELKASLIVIGNYNVTLPASDVKSLATIAGEARVVRINEGRMAGDVFDGAWAPRVYDFGGTITDLQKINGELAYQILAQRDKALSFSRSQLVQEATRVPARPRRRTGRLRRPARRTSMGRGEGVMHCLHGFRATAASGVATRKVKLSST